MELRCADPGLSAAPPSPLAVRLSSRGARGSIAAAGLVLGLLACGPTATFSGGVFRRGAVAYRVGPLSPDWQRLRSSGSDLAFRHTHGGTVVVHGQCPAQDDAPLDVLTNHLLFGVTARKEQARTTLSLDGREALRTQLFASVDGVTVGLDLVVLKKDGCLYDLQLIAGPAHFAARQPDFTAFVAGFATQKDR